MDWPEQVGRPSEVLQRQLEEERLARLTSAQLLANRRVVRRTVLDRVVEDRRVRGKPGDRQVPDVVLERASIQQIACDVVEPDALAHIAKRLRRFHRVTSVPRVLRPQ
jgi:hypothetical protein